MPTYAEAKQWNSMDDPVHGWDHVQRVCALAEWLAGEVGADVEIVRAAALLHDVAGAAPAADESDAPGRVTHEQASAEFARRRLAEEGWSPPRIEAVLHCIRSHRFRTSEPPTSLEARVLFDADKLDVLGAFGAARTIAYAVQAGTPIYARPSERYLSSGEVEPGEAHSAYHEYWFKLRKILGRLHTEPARALGRERQAVLTTFFEALAAEAAFGEPPADLG
jgi:uncharacterized protein